jgi:hypothetical protein
MNREEPFRKKEKIKIAAALGSRLRFEGGSPPLRLTWSCFLGAGRLTLTRVKTVDSDFRHMDTMNAKV